MNTTDQQRARRQLEWLIENEHLLQEGFEATALPDMWRRYGRNTWNLSLGQRDAIARAYNRIMSDDPRSAYESHPPPIKYDNCQLARKDQTYYIEVDGKQIGPAVSKKEGTLILRWFHEALDDLKSGERKEREDPDAPLPIAFDTAVAELVAELERVEIDSDAWRRALARADERYRKVEKNERGLTVKEDAETIVRFRSKREHENQDGGIEIEEVPF